MSEAYAIAKYLSDEDKQRILAHRFVRAGEETGERDADGLPIVYVGKVPASIDDEYCPLAYVGGLSCALSAPEPEDVALALSARAWPPLSDEQYDERYDAAEVFINDWDDGKITDLYAALGVERRGS